MSRLSYVEPDFSDDGSDEDHFDINDTDTDTDESVIYMPKSKVNVSEPKMYDDIPSSNSKSLSSSNELVSTSDSIIVNTSVSIPPAKEETSVKSSFWLQKFLAIKKTPTLVEPPEFPPLSNAILEQFRDSNVSLSSKQSADDIDDNILDESESVIEVTAAINNKPERKTRITIKIFNLPFTMTADKVILYNFCLSYKFLC